MMPGLNLPPTSKKARINTDPSINSLIDRRIDLREKHYRDASISELSQSIRELDNEWDTERVLEVSFASIVILSTVLGLTNKKWYAVGGAAAGFMLLHALQGWCPPLPLIRKLGIRTADEINREKTIAKIYRGDYDYYQIINEA